MSSFGSGLAKTRQAFFGRIAQMMGNTTITEDTWDEMEALLLQADLGVATTNDLTDTLKGRVRREGITRADQLSAALKEELVRLLKAPTPLNISGRALSVMLIVG
ncbi:MAG: signal recognition particle receptor subunit alpha, partial [Anaerolineae bacterium]|nr:signal recognition particle receptor subunit alpha [Anaerolineae bacterium]